VLSSSNRDYPADGKVRVTIQETSTEIQPVYDGYPSSQHGSLNRTEVQQRNYSNNHTASNATKELDDLMASLSEFKVHVQHPLSCDVTCGETPATVIL